MIIKKNTSSDTNTVPSGEFIVDSTGILQPLTKMLQTQNFSLSTTVLDDTFCVNNSFAQVESKQLLANCF